MLTEDFRPKTLDEVVGQPAAVAKVRRLAEANLLIGKVFWIIGPSSSGKTTIGRIIANMVSQKYAQEEFPADDLSVDRIRDIERMCRCRPVGGGVHCLIINESHLLRGPILARLNTTFENPLVINNSTWVFTTTTAGHKKLFDDDEIETVPFGSRTTPIKLVQPDVVTIAEHVRKIAQAAGCDGKPLGDYCRLAKDNSLSIRACLNAVEAGAMLD